MKNNIYVLYRHTSKITGTIYVGMYKEHEVSGWGDTGQGYEPANMDLIDLKVNWCNYSHERLHLDSLEHGLALSLKRYYIGLYMAVDCCKRNNREPIEKIIDNTSICMIKDYCKSKQFICVLSIWNEVLGITNRKPSRWESDFIVKVLNDIDFIEKLKSTLRIEGYGVQRCWVNKIIGYK